MARACGPVVFPHWFHRIRYRCKVCHADLGFKFKAGGNEINMVKVIDGQFCGACHNGEVAWNVENCNMCHSGKTGHADAGAREHDQLAGAAGRCQEGEEGHDAAHLGRPGGGSDRMARRAAAWAADAGKAIYDSGCVACHGTGVLGAPKLGDAAAWKARLAAGLPALVNSAKVGKGTMPPKGGNPALTDAQMLSVVDVYGGSIGRPAAARRKPAAGCGGAPSRAPALAAAGGRAGCSGGGSPPRLRRLLRGRARCGSAAPWSRRRSAGQRQFLQPAAAPAQPAQPSAGRRLDPRPGQRRHAWRCSRR